MDICHYTFVQTHRTCNTTHFNKVNPKVNCGLWFYDVSTQFVLGLKKKRYHSVDNGYACVGRGYMGEFLYLPVNFVVNLKLL